MFDKTTARGLLALALAACTVAARADVFNMPTGDTSLQFVAVGDAGNVADPTTGLGAVGYAYQMGEYDVTLAQYCEFLNAVAKTDTYDLYNPIMGTYYPTVAIVQSGSSGNYSYSVAGGRNGTDSAAANCPAFGISWGDAARFCNWLQNGQPVGAEGSATTENGAYSLNGATSDSALMKITRNPGAIYVIPSENEWYKAAYYVGGGTNAGYWLYPTQSNTAPSNVLSATGANNANYYDGDDSDPTNLLTPVGAFVDSPGAYGTYDMGGDVWQWNEAILSPETRAKRGGDCNLSSADMLSSYDSNVSEPQNGYSPDGFRVAEVPEPGSIALLPAGGICLLAYAWRRRRLA